MKNLKKLVLICTTNHVPKFFSASELSVIYPGIEAGRGAGNSNSEHSVPHLGWKGVRGGESENSSSGHSIPHPGVEGGRGEEWKFRLQAFLFLTLGLKGVGGRSGNSNSEHSIPLPGV